MLDAIRIFITTYERKLEYAALAAIVALVFYLGWHIQGWRYEARRSQELQAAIAAHAAGEEKSHTIGMNLETGLNDYRPAAKEIDRKVQHATNHDAGNRFDVSSVQRTAERISTGEAARQRANPVR